MHGHTVYGRGIFSITVLSLVGYIDLTMSKRVTTARASHAEEMTIFLISNSLFISNMFSIHHQTMSSEKKIIIN